MTIYQIELIDPKAKMLLEDLAKMNLIKLTEVEDVKRSFQALLLRLRSKNEMPLSLEEITQEVEEVRQKRHEDGA